MFPFVEWCIDRIIPEEGASFTQYWGNKTQHLFNILPADGSTALLCVMFTNDVN